MSTSSCQEEQPSGSCNNEEWVRHALLLAVQNMPRLPRRVATSGADRGRLRERQRALKLEKLENEKAEAEKAKVEAEEKMETMERELKKAQEKLKEAEESNRLLLETQMAAADLLSRPLRFCILALLISRWSWSERRDRWGARQWSK